MDFYGIRINNATIARSSLDKLSLFSANYRIISYYIVIYHTPQQCTTCLMIIMPSGCTPDALRQENRSERRRGRSRPDRRCRHRLCRHIFAANTRYSIYYGEGTSIHTTCAIISHTRAHFRALIRCKTADCTNPRPHRREGSG